MRPVSVSSFQGDTDVEIILYQIPLKANNAVRRRWLASKSTDRSHECGGAAKLSYPEGESPSSGTPYHVSIGRRKAAEPVITMPVWAARYRKSGFDLPPLAPFKIQALS